MYTIKNDISNLIEIKNSKFITLLIRINSSDIKQILEELKVKYPKATHYCYGYIYNEDKKSSDDNEPTGTAGIPILNVLEKENLNNVLAVVIRYFGGIKLGAGGLIRAYTKSITEALKQAEYTKLIEGYKVEIKFSYPEEKEVDYLLKDNQIIKKDYQEDITYQVLIPKNEENKLYNYNYQILEEIYIEKEK